MIMSNNILMHIHDQSAVRCADMARITRPYFADISVIFSRK